MSIGYWGSIGARTVAVRIRCPRLGFGIWIPLSAIGATVYALVLVWWVCCAFGVFPDALCQVGRLRALDWLWVPSLLLLSCFVRCARCRQGVVVVLGAHLWHRCTGVANKVLFKVLFWRSWWNGAGHGVVLSARLGTAKLDESWMPLFQRAMQSPEHRIPKISVESKPSLLSCCRTGLPSSTTKHWHAWSIKMMRRAVGCGHFHLQTRLIS